VTYRNFFGYSEISNSPVNTQMKSFHKNVIPLLDCTVDSIGPSFLVVDLIPSTREQTQWGEFPTFQKVLFLGVWCRRLSLTKMDVMDMSYIMENKSNRLKTTFPNIFSLMSADPADLPLIRKNHSTKKNHDLLIENLL